MDYSRAVIERFRHRSHAAAPGERAPLSGAAGRRKRGAAVELLLWPQGGRLRQVRYRVFGCPYLVAGAELLAERLEGEAVSALDEFSARDLACDLAVPVERLGRLLLLEDAARYCARQLGTIPQGET